MDSKDELEEALKKDRFFKGNGVWNETKREEVRAELNECPWCKKSILGDGKVLYSQQNATHGYVYVCNSCEVTLPEKVVIK